MQMTTYVCFKGECEAAFKLYERTLGAQIGPMFRYGESPMANQVAPDWSNKVMHGSLTIGGQVLMGADLEPNRYEPPRGFSLSLQIDNTAEAERIFAELSEAGRVVTPLEKTFWAERFGVFIDRFGIQWVINCEQSGRARK
jgi:PhnB protein